MNSANSASSLQLAIIRPVGSSNLGTVVATYTVPSAGAGIFSYSFPSDVTVNAGDFIAFCQYGSVSYSNTSPGNLQMMQQTTTCELHRLFHIQIPIILS